MPVVISLLNSFTGVAAACGGFLYQNKVMLMGGVLVGSAGTILTVVMCKAMNRSLMNVLIGMAGGNGGGSTTSASGGSVRGASNRCCRYDEICVQSDHRTWLRFGRGSGPTRLS